MKRYKIFTRDMQFILLIYSKVAGCFCSVIHPDIGKSILKLINNSSRENNERKSLQWPWFEYICVPNYHKILPTLVLNFSIIIWEAISNTQKCVSSDMQTRRSRLNKTGCASFFQPTSQCLDIWWNTPSRVWYITYPTNSFLRVIWISNICRLLNFIA